MNYRSLSNTPMQAFLALMAIVLLVIPIFLSGGGIFNSTEESARGLPVSLSLLLLAPTILFLRHSFIAATLLLVAIMLIVTPFLLYGVLDSLYLQFVLVGSYTLPMLTGYTAFSILNYTSKNNHQVVFIVMGNILSAVSILWLTYQIPIILTSGRATGEVWGIFTIYQVWVYWPTVLALIFCTQMSFTTVSANIKKIILGLAILATGAREPILFIVIFSIIYNLKNNNVGSVLKLIVSLFIALMVVYVAVTNFPDLIISLKVRHMLEGAQSLDAGRFDVLEAFNFSDINPLIGTGFSSSGIWGSPHNQYAALFYRGGLISALLPSLITFFILYKYKSSETVLWSLLATIFIVSFNVNVPLRAPYSATLIWYLIFLFASLHSVHRNFHETTPSKSL